MKLLIIDLCLFTLVTCLNIEDQPIYYKTKNIEAKIASELSNAYHKFKYKLKVASDLFNSFVKIISKVSGRFKLNTPKIEKKRRKIKTALHSFVKEAFYDNATFRLTENPLNVIYEDNSATETSEEALMSTEQLAGYHGYQVEVHSVQTGDGYMLGLHRILPSSKKPKEVINNVVILHHGLMGSSTDWLLLGPKQALPYLLSEQGYDVWMTNARGNAYSRIHVSYPESSSKFWDFSFHEMGTFDLPAVIDYVKDNSKSDLIDFVGFSMGASAGLVLLSSLPRYNQILNSATLLAPLAFMYQIKGPLKLLAEFQAENGHNSVSFLGVDEFKSVEGFPVQVIQKYCRSLERLCLNPLLLIANGGKDIQNEHISRIVLGHLPAGASTRTILHYIQLINSGEFRSYDFDVSNYKRYNQNVPLRYKLSSITLPIVLFSSRDDWLSTHPNVLRLLAVLPNVIVHHVVDEEDFSHTDFVWGERAPDLVFQLVIGILKQSHSQ